MKNRDLAAAFAAALAGVAISAGARPKVFGGPTLGEPPILDHVVAPRHAIDLCGKGWTVAEIGLNDNPDKGEHIPTSVPYGCGYEKTKMWVFRRTFDLSAEDVSRRVWIEFEEVGDTAELFVNGKFCGRHVMEGFGWKPDISDAVQPGENALEVRVWNELNGPRPNRDWGGLMHDWELSGHMGITLPLHLETADRVSILGVRITTKVIPDKVMTAVVTVTNATAKTVMTECRGIRRSIAPFASVEINIVEKRPDAHLWTPDDPHLETEEFRIPTDALRVRYGFREFDFSGERLLLNGHPMIDIRETVDFGRLPTRKSINEKIDILKGRGFNGMRLFLPNALKRITRAADEKGLFVSICFRTGYWGAGGASDVFWHKNLPAIMRGVLDAAGNAPSVICWGIGNEFGGIYGGKNEKAVASEAEAGMLLRSLDPTRAWCYYGEGEVGWPLYARGPCPIRSLHYPSSPSGPWHRIPEDFYWVTKEHWGWNGVWHHDKPLVISEDIYHGMLDSCRVMSEAGGDKIYSYDGFFDTVADYLRNYAAGYYLCGLSGWNPWATGAAEKDNPLYDDPVRAPFRPHFLNVRDIRRNFAAGGKIELTLDVHNRSFTTCRGSTVELSLGGKDAWRVPLDLDVGEDRVISISRLAPDTDTARPYILKAIWRTVDGMTLDKREFPVFLHPRRPVLPSQDVALVAASDSPIRRFSFGKGVYDDADAAIKSGARKIVVATRLKIDEGLRLAKYASGGAEILQLEPDEKGYSPIETVPTKDYHAFLKNADALPGLDERMLFCWNSTNGPSTLLERKIPLPTGQDLQVLADVGSRNGVRDAAAIRIYFGKGVWTMVTLPVISRLDHEPAAGSFLAGFVGELAKGAPRHDKALVVAPRNGTYAQLLRNWAVASEQRIANPSATVLLVDASGGFTSQLRTAVERVTAAGGNAMVVGLKRPQDLPSDWPITGKTRKSDVWGPCPARFELGAWAPFVWRTGASGVLAGVSNEALIWWPGDDLPRWFQTYAYKGFDRHWKSDFAMDFELVTKPGASEALTEPCAMATFNLGRGRVVVTTLRFDRNVIKRGADIEIFFRTILGNLGARTSAVVLTVPPKWHPMNTYYVANRSFAKWDDERWAKYIRKNAHQVKKLGGPAKAKCAAWFGGEDDMRYYPMNQVGYSPITHAACPVEEFPGNPFTYGGVKFILRNPNDPVTANRTIAIAAPGEGMRFEAMDSNRRAVSWRARRIWVLGAAEKGTHEGLSGELEASISFVVSKDAKGRKKLRTVKAKAEPGAHFGGYAEVEPTPKGHLAWNGHTFKKNNAALYAFAFVVPEDAQMLELNDVTVRNATNAQFAFVALTVEE